jgi:protein-S-isoprenylcysteine O-methyltransferase Ste14
MFGFGIYYSSVLTIFISIPLYILLDVSILKRIEEPDLEKRLGAAYAEYKNKTPMFFPWKNGKM